MRYLLSRRLRFALALLAVSTVTLQVGFGGTIAIAADEENIIENLVQNDFGPVTLCHQKGNGAFVEITVSTQGALNGHMGHEGDIIPAPEDGCNSLNPKADLNITKTVDEPLPNIGGALTYSLKVTNNGPDTALGVVVTDVLPAGLTFVSADPAAEYDSGTGIWTIGDLPSGESALLDINATANLDAGDTTVVNSATVTSDSYDPNEENNTAEAPVDIGIPSGGLEPCVEGPAHINEVVSSTQGTLNNADPITDPTRTDVSRTLGVSDGGFFSLGKGGSVVNSFAGFVLDVPGDDVVLHEITNGRDDYPEEKATVEISQDGVTWFLVGTASSKDTDGVSSFDIASTGLSWFTMVRTTDATDFSIHDATADGYDLDAIDATYQSCVLVKLEKKASYDSTTGTLYYTIYWEVVGGIANVVITDPLPAGITYVGGSADNGGAYDGGTHTLTWDLGSHSGGDIGTVSFNATLDAALALNMWASSVTSFTQGTDADLVTSVDPSRSDATKALGAAQSAGNIYDNPLPDFLGEFVSLGFTDGDTGGQLVVAFDQPVYNGPGNDLQIFEITGGESYPDEAAQIAVSNDNATWTDVGVVVRDGGVDLGAVTQANYVRITDTSDRTQFEQTADAFDVDAVKALHLVPYICKVVNTAVVNWTVFTDNIPTTSSLSTSVSTVINQSACTEEDNGGSEGGGGNNNGGSITGLVFSDANNSAELDGGESSLSGWVVYLDTNDNGLLDGGEVSTTTASPYAFTGLADGTYNVREVLQGGWTQTLPTAGQSFKYVVNISGGNSVTNKDFGNFQATGGGGGGGASSSSTTGGGGGGAPGGQILGDSTNTPSGGGTGAGASEGAINNPIPAVLGATELPRTGTGPLGVVVIGFVSLVFTFGVRKFKQVYL